MIQTPKFASTFSHLKFAFLLGAFCRCLLAQEMEGSGQQQQILLLRKLMTDNKLKFEKNMGSTTVPPLESASIDTETKGVIPPDKYPLTALTGPLGAPFTEEWEGGADWSMEEPFPKLGREEGPDWSMEEALLQPGNKGVPDWSIEEAIPQPRVKGGPDWSKEEPSPHPGGTTDGMDFYDDGTESRLLEDDEYEEDVTFLWSGGGEKEDPSSPPREFLRDLTADERPMEAMLRSGGARFDLSRVGGRRGTWRRKHAGGTNADWRTTHLRPNKSPKKETPFDPGTGWHSSQNDVTKPDQSALYTKWSKWSRCSRHCQQTRRRRCRIPDLCGTALLKEKRPCVGWRCQHEKFHLIKADEMARGFPPEADLLARPSPPRADVRVLLNYNSMFYTKWSEWAACSRTCLTSRYRSCRYSLFCGNAVIREEAYCYTRNSACEKWYQRHKLDSMGDRAPSEADASKDRTSPSNRTGSSTDPSDQQVVFGHNKFVTENGFVPPRTDTTQILNFQIQAPAPPHRFSPVRQTGSHNNVVSAVNSNAKDYYWMDKGKGGSQPPSKGAASENESHFFKKPGYINNLSGPQKKPNQYWNEKEANRGPQQATFQSVGRANALPSSCGLNGIKKQSWTLKIIGGREAAPQKWPWQVAILNRFKEVFCGGTLVAPQWIVTAAHCLRKKLFVRLAEHDIAISEGPEVEFRITETVSHPLYDSTTVDNDVALLRLPHPVSLGVKVAPACVPEQGAPLPVGMQCTIIGWGKERNTHFFGTDVLNEAEVPVINEDTCRKVYHDYYITQNMFCAGYRKGRIDSCAGDSGGPLLCHFNGLWYIYGITSFGEGCGRKGKFGIYAKVSNYRTWINDVIGAHAHRDSSAKTASHKKHKHRHHKSHAKYGKRYRRRSHTQFHSPKNSTERIKLKFRKGH